MILIYVIKVIILNNQKGSSRLVVLSNNQKGFSCCSFTKKLLMSLKSVRSHLICFIVLFYIYFLYLFFLSKYKKL